MLNPRNTGVFSQRSPTSVTVERPLLISSCSQRSPTLVTVEGPLDISSTLSTKPSPAHLVPPCPRVLKRLLCTCPCSPGQCSHWPSGLPSPAVLSRRWRARKTCPRVCSYNVHLATTSTQSNTFTSNSHWHHTHAHTHTPINPNLKHTS